MTASQPTAPSLIYYPSLYRGRYCSTVTLDVWAVAIESRLGLNKQMMVLRQLIVLLFVGCEGLQSPLQRAVSPRVKLSQRFSENEPAAPPSTPPVTKNRLGSSIDQDGKSNIWAVEPKMRVQEADSGSGQAIAIAVGAVVAFGLIASSFLFINVEQ